MSAPQRPLGDASVRAYVGLGSNLAEPLGQLRRALQALAGLGQTRLIRCSGVYRNPPMIDPRDDAPTAQADYLNAVAAIATRLGPQQLLRALLAQEDRQGRRRSARRWEARCIDLDLLLYGERRINSRDLTLPHPGLSQRPFVIHPLAEIAPEAPVPGLGPAARLAKLVAKNTLVLVCPGSELLE